VLLLIAIAYIASGDISIITMLNILQITQRTNVRIAVWTRGHIIAHAWFTARLAVFNADICRITVAYVATHALVQIIAYRANGGSTTVAISHLVTKVTLAA